MVNPIYRLCEARELRGYSVAELAEKLGVTRQVVYKYEGGMQRPSNETMDRIIEILDFPLSFFSSPHMGVQIGDRPVFFRNMKTNIEKNRKMAKRWLQLLVDRVAEYERELEIQKADLPPVDIDDFQAIDMEDVDALAEKTRRYWGLGDGPISDLTLLMENNGIVIAHKDLETDKLDACSLIANGRPCVLVNTNKQTGARVLSDLAHELGHLIMHQNVEEHDIANAATLDLIERQAWRFAGSFLMPPASFTNELGYPSISKYVLLKKRWRTSIASMIMHSYDLCVITEERKQYFFRELSRNNMRKNEPFDDVLRIEKSSLLFECEQEIMRAGLRNKDELLQASGLNATDYCSLISAPEDYYRPQPRHPKLRLVGSNQGKQSNVSRS